MNKYRNVKTLVDGITFDSKKEAKRYSELKILEKAGEISRLRSQPKYLLQPSYQNGTKKIRAIHYIADFEYNNKYCETIVEDVKGMKTDVYKLKKKLFEYIYQPLTINEI
jgi:hypothetical protein